MPRAGPAWGPECTRAYSLWAPWGCTPNPYNISVRIKAGTGSPRPSGSPQAYRPALHPSALRSPVFPFSTKGGLTLGSHPFLQEKLASLQKPLS